MRTVEQQLHARAEHLSAEFPREYPDSARAIGDAIEHLGFVLSHASVPKDRRHIAAAAYGGRVLQHGYAAYRLLKMGDIPSAEVVLRSALEATFALGGLANPSNFEGGKDFFLRLRYKSISTSLRALKNYIRSETSLIEPARTKLKARQEALEKSERELKQHAMTKTSEVAEAAGMADFYRKEYAFQSQSSHADVEAVIQKHVSIEGEEIHVSGMALSHDGANAMSAHLVLILMETSSAVADLFDVELPKIEQERSQSLAEFYERAITR